MVRDMDLVRDLLLRIESDPLLDGTREFIVETPEELGIQNRSADEVAYHVALIIEAGFVNGRVTMPTRKHAIRRLTWDGHEFLDNIRDPGIWGKTKARLSGLPGVALSVVAEIAKAEVRRHLGLA